MQSKLLPCPFCGGEAQLKQTGSKQITIRCKSCPAKMVQKVLRYSVEWLEESMIGDWNKRAAEQPLAPDAAHALCQCENLTLIDNPKICPVCELPRR